MRQWASKYWFVAACTLVTVLFGYAWRLQCGGFDADLEFSHIALLTDFGARYECPVNSFDEVLTRVSACYYYDNGRLANFVMPAVYWLVPQWLSALFCTLVIAWLPMAILLVAGGKRILQRPWIVMCAYLLFWLAPTWDDNMTTHDFFSNYFVGMALYFVAVLLAQRRAQLWVLAIMAVLLAWWHEEIGVMLMAAYGVFAIWQRRGSLWWLVGLMAVVIALCLSSPGMQTRGGEQVALNVFTSFGQWFNTRVVFESLLIWVALLGVVIVALVPRWHGSADWAAIAIFAVPMLAALGIVVVAQAFGRAFIPPVICAIGLIAVVLNLLPSRVTRVSRMATAACGVAFLTAYAWFFVVLAHWQSIMRDNKVNYNNAVYAAGQTPIAFADTISLGQVPWYSLGCVTPEAVYGRDIWQAQQRPYCYHNLTSVTVLPERFSGKRYHQWPLVPGNTGMRGTVDVWLWNRRVDTLRAEVTFGPSMPAQTPWREALRLLTYGTVPHTQQVVLHCDSVGIYPSGAIDADTIYKYWFDGRGQSVTYATIQSVDFK